MSTRIKEIILQVKPMTTDNEAYSEAVQIAKENKCKVSYSFNSFNISVWEANDADEF